LGRCVCQDPYSEKDWIGSRKKGIEIKERWVLSTVTNIYVSIKNNQGAFGRLGHAKSGSLKLFSVVCGVDTESTLDRRTI
jgi:hypothetical protein